jgi:hypothetical protein
MYDIRFASLFDVMDIVNLQEAHRKEVKGFSLLTFDRERCLESMARVVNNVDHIVLVAKSPLIKGLAGYMWLAPVAVHYSQQYYYSEQFTYVTPRYRNTRVLSCLINAGKEVSKSQGASYVQLGSFSGNDKLTAAYNKRFHKVGECFLINLKE